MTELMKSINTWFTNLIRCYLARARKICEVLSKFCQANFFNFQSNQDSLFVKHIKFEKRKALKTELNEELMPIAWHA